MIIILQEKVEPQQILDMLAEYGYMIKKLSTFDAQLWLVVVKCIPIAKVCY